MSVTKAFPRIHRLETEVANQIAAGEVIERPASVVKELVENSIDASATHIIVEVENAGSTLILVKDNGQGIYKNDLKLALTPHATSKLSSVSDLNHIASLGFRGEALPSIASVSRFLLTSKQNNEPALSIDHELSIKPASHNQGTTVEVQDLFYATPARRKFLKSERTEFLRIQSILKAIALGHIDISFRFIHDEQKIFHYVTAESKPEQRIIDILGKSFIRKSLYVDDERDNMRLYGWIGSAEQSRSHCDRQFFFINGRLIQDKHVNHAIKLAYADKIPPGRYASYVLYLQIDPSEMDINVHPSKSEVRFAEVRNVHDFIYAALSQTFTLQTKITFDEIMDKNNNVEDVHTAYPITKKELINNNSHSSRYFYLQDGKYVITNQDADCLIVNVHQAMLFLVRERINQEISIGKLQSRSLGLPITINLSSKEIATVKTHQQELMKLGFEFNLNNKDIVSVLAIPVCLPYADLFKLILALLNDMQINQTHEQMVNTMLSHANIENCQLNDEMLDKLIEEIKEYESKLGHHYSGVWRYLDDQFFKLLLTNE